MGGNYYCIACFEYLFTYPTHTEKANFNHIVKPTVCNFCGENNGLGLSKSISVHPVCEKCEKEIDRKVFPLWVKGFIVAVIIITGISFYINQPFYLAYIEEKEADEFFFKKQYAEASLLIESSLSKVPESENLELKRNYYTGLYYLSNDRNADALNRFLLCREKVSGIIVLNKLISKAQLGIHFEIKDYETYFKECYKRYLWDTSKVYFIADLASAYACLYATKGVDSSKQKAAYFLKKSLYLAKDDKEIKEHSNRIEYRLYSRNILSTSEFNRKYPKGWVKPM